MASKSGPTTSMVQCGSSRRQKGCHTDPITYTAEDPPSEGCSQTFSAARSASANTGPPNKTGHTDSEETACLPGPSSAAVLATKDRKTSCKRKSTSHESTEGQKKRSRGTPSLSEEPKEISWGSFSSSDDAGTSITASVTSSPESTETKKRKAEETVGHRNKCRRTPSPSEGPSHQASTEPSTSDQPGTSSSVDTVPPHSKAAFRAKYKEEQLLGKGGHGSVFAGYRKMDKLPVAIKHICLFGVEHISMPVEGKNRMVPKEVALLLKLKTTAPGTSAVVSLLDWYSLDYEVILVLERPVPCMDLVDYMYSKQSALQEQEAKIITKQLVDALIEVNAKGVFHRDIKLDNILVETGSDVPRIRLIDFGCGTFLSGERYIQKQGTYWYTSPEWHTHGWYTAEPTTVWQLGVVLFGILHRHLPFSDSCEIVSATPNIREDLTDECSDFLWSCLTKSPEERANLNTLKNHPWLDLALAGKD